MCGAGARVCVCRCARVCAFAACGHVGVWVFGDVMSAYDACTGTHTHASKQSACKL